MPDPDKLQALFRDGPNRWIAEKLRERVQRGRPLQEGTLFLADPSPAERTARDDLLGRSSSRAQRIAVPLAALTRILREAGLADDLDDVVRACFGEVANHRALEAESTARWTGIFDRARARVAGDASARDWIDSLQKDGLLKKLTFHNPAAAEGLLDRALRVHARFPLPGLTLAELAGQETGDTHALDRTRPLAALLLRAVKYRTGIDGRLCAAERRRAWESVGVVVDQLSAPALTFQLRAAPHHPLHPILEGYRAASLPAFLSFRSLLGENPFRPLPAGLEDVYIVENPSLLDSAISRLGSKCRPLLCTEGVPASSLTRLLGLLRDAGARLHARADFDATGLRIVDSLVREFGALPWRMDPATYLAAPGDLAHEGDLPNFPWAGDLTAAMRQRGVAVHEETCATRLLKDLAP